MLKKNKNENKRLQCKAKSHISERPYFYKKTVSVSLFSLCGLLLVKNANTDTTILLATQYIQMGFFFFGFVLLFSLLYSI